MKTFLKIFTIFLFSVSNLLFAGDPPVPGGGGGGSTGPGGAPQNSIDMYLIWLAVVAVVAVIYLFKTNKKQLV